MLIAVSAPSATMETIKSIAIGVLVIVVVRESTVVKPDDRTVLLPVLRREIKKMPENSLSPQQADGVLRGKQLFALVQI